MKMTCKQKGCKNKEDETGYCPKCFDKIASAWARGDHYKDPSFDSEFNEDW
jgi:hypothetical protein